jgi:hypothetical protein
VVYGWAFDTMGRYDAALMAGVGCLVVGGIALLGMGRYPLWREAAAP